MRPRSSSVIVLLILAAALAAGPSSNAVAENPADSGWANRVLENIRAAEYEFSIDTDGNLSAPNRAHNLRSRLSEDGLRLTARVGKRVDWLLELRLVSHGRGDKTVTLRPSYPESRGGRATLWRGQVNEWYLNTEEGLEQGFDIAAPPEGRRDEGQVVLTMIVGGDVTGHLAEDGQAVVFTDRRGSPVVYYRELRVIDSTGRVLDAYITTEGRRLSLLFDDRDAAYPVTVDPLLTTASWNVESNNATARLGASVATAGDVNGDGYSDVIVGAPLFDGGQTDEGKAFVYHGAASGPSTTAAWSVESNVANAQYGFSVATTGDVNGDGYADVIVGAPKFKSGTGQTDEGRISVYHGSSSGLSTTATTEIEFNTPNTEFGTSVATAGDVNGDGYSDVIVGAPFYDGGQTNEGKAFVYHGGSGGVSTSSSWSVESNVASAQYGFSVATAGDVNGDGYADVIVGAPKFKSGTGQTDEGRISVYHGSSSGLSTTATTEIEFNTPNTEFGTSVATAGDVNGDGYSDVIVGAPFYDGGQTNEGKAFVYHGGSGGVSASSSWSVESNVASAQYGSSVATAGDVNGDGVGDVIVGAPRLQNGAGQADEGKAFVYLGAGASGLSTTPYWAVEGDANGVQFGTSVATAGDVNGDGFSDVIVGKPFYASGQNNEGQASIFTGFADGLATTAAWTAEADQASASLGTSIASAGDVNGDGYSDVIVGAPNYDFGETDEGRVWVYHGSSTGLATTAAWTAEANQASASFGISVGTAGDVNGDGYSDVIVGAPNYDNGETDEGRAWVYHGSSTGLAATAAWTAEANQASAFFGRSVGTAGDVNGDGYSDVIVGAPNYDNGETDEGRAWVYHGSSTGLAATAAWTAEANQASASFGISVGSAGDVNRDGYSDVIVGAYRYDVTVTDEGRAAAYNGSSSGLGASPSWTAAGGQLNDLFGSSVGTAGDVNGDGYSDVIVGAALYDSNSPTITDDGRASIFHGSSTGLSFSAAWTKVGGQTNAAFGSSVGSAGDVNGDGFSDVVVTAPTYSNGQSQEGRAFVYHGSSTGAGSSSSWTGESNQASANFGSSAVGAGDVNGDGFGDLLVGANLYNGGQIGEGRAFLYFGNLGDGLDRTPRQLRVGTTTSVERLGISDENESFRLRALGRTAAGRGKVRLQWEVKALGTAFNATGIQQGTSTDTGAPGAAGSAVTLTETVSGLNALTIYHWRVRAKSTSPFFPWTPWLTVPGNSRTETEIRMPNDCAICQVEYCTGADIGCRATGICGPGDCCYYQCGIEMPGCTIPQCPQYVCGGC